MKPNLVAKILEENIEKEAMKWTTQKATKQHKTNKKMREFKKNKKKKRKFLGRLYSDERNFMWKGEQEDSAKNSVESRIDEVRGRSNKRSLNRTIWRLDETHRVGSR